jgi:hypothetical protein
MKTMETIRDYYKGKAFGSYVVDPHTAVGLTAGCRIAHKKCEHVFRLYENTF